MHFSASIKSAHPGPLLNLKGIFQACPRIISLMKRPYEPIPEPVVDSETAQNASKREYPKRKVAMIMGYSGTGYQGMQR